MVSNSQKAESCQQSLQSSQKGNNPIDVEVISAAKAVEASCSQLSQASSNLTQIDALKERGKALLLLGKGSQTLKQTEDAQKRFTQAKSVFENALKSDQNNPQARFYLGLAKQLMNERDYANEFNTAINLYSNPGQKKIQVEDYPILAKLAAFLVQEPGKLGYSPNNFQKADQLYAKAIDVQLKLSALQYNRGVLNYRTNNPSNLQKAVTILGKASEIDKNNLYVNRYIQTCLGGNKNVALCRSPNTILPSTQPVYACSEYPVLAIAKLGSANPDDLCQ